MISSEELAEAVNGIFDNNYRLTPLYRIYFQPGIVVDQSFMGIPVFPIENESNLPAVALGKTFEYETFYMKPLDELVLSALGELLLQIHYPYYLEDRVHVATMNETLFQESRVNGAKGIAALVYIETCGNRLISTLTYHFLLAPFHYYQNGTKLIINQIAGEILHGYNEPVHYFGTISKVPFFYEYLSLISQKIDA